MRGSPMVFCSTWSHPVGNIVDLSNHFMQHQISYPKDPGSPSPQMMSENGVFSITETKRKVFRFTILSFGEPGLLGIDIIATVITHVCLWLIGR